MKINPFRINTAWLIALATIIAFGTKTNAVNAAAKKQQWTLTSPDGRLATTVGVQHDGKLWYSVSKDGAPVLEPSAMSMTLASGKQLGTRISSLKATRRNNVAFNAAMPVYRKSRITATLNTLTLNAGQWGVELLATNEGVAYRFITQYGDSLRIKSERNTFALPQGSTMHYLPVGGFTSAFEGVYSHGAVADIDTSVVMAPQVLVELPCGKKLLLSDYNVRHYPTMCLKAQGNALASVYPGYPAREEEWGTYGTRYKVTQTEPYIAKTTGTNRFPWRMMLVADDDASLLTPDLPAILADQPAQGDDFSWLKPGKAAWEWWNAHNLKGVDFRAGINNATYKYYIDFAARNGIEYILMDDGWTKPQRPLDLLQTIEAVNIPQLVEYGRQRGVGIVLWADYHPFDKDMERIIDTYATMGIKGFKIDHFNRNDQKAVDFTWRAARECAKRHLFIDFHGIFPPTGLQVTYPNVLNYEAVLGLETVKWRKQYDALTHECLVPFIRQAVGPIDYTQGAMRNVQPANYHARSGKPMAQGTRCRQLAEFVIFESPFNMLCDSPTNYETPYNQPCASFIGQVPTVWDETRVLAAKLGQYIVMARRKGQTWYVGGITNGEARDIELELSFAQDANACEIFKDGINADRDAEDYMHEDRLLPSSHKLTVHMSPGGGFAAKLQ